MAKKWGYSSVYVDIVQCSGTTIGHILMDCTVSGNQDSNSIEVGTEANDGYFIIDLVNTVCVYRKLNHTNWNRHRFTITASITMFFLLARIFGIERFLLEKGRRINRSRGRMRRPIKT